MWLLEIKHSSSTGLRNYLTSCRRSIDFWSPVRRLVANHPEAWKLFLKNHLPKITESHDDAHYDIIKCRLRLAVMTLHYCRLRLAVITLHYCRLRLAVMTLHYCRLRLAVMNLHYCRSWAGLTRSSYLISVWYLMFVIQSVLGLPVVTFPSDRIYQ